ncbi:unnamed protein product [Enterobius vermicularis]|uniref:39S ribosomal protein L54, mitochondrial n=1 Tax=Enterobius vermicularis TaxID=51028 RepID=A0A0N4USY8_ENTVE|nr:unnamed protein product [Enterobius vermicularis]
MLSSLRLIRSFSLILKEGVQSGSPGVTQNAVRNLAAVKKTTVHKEDKSFVDMDTEKLCSYYGGEVNVNLFTHLSAEEPGPKILPNDQYPDWLFKLNLERRKELEDLDPEIDGWAYWRAFRKRQLEQSRRIRMLKYRFLHLQNSPSMKRSQGLSYKPAKPK